MLDPEEGGGREEAGREGEEGGRREGGGREGGEEGGKRILVRAVTSGSCPPPRSCSLRVLNEDPVCLHNICCVIKNK